MIYDLQKASMWKRISAFLFDGILLSIAAVLLGWLLSVLVGYDGYSQQVENSYAKYEAQYGVNMRLSLSEYDALTQEQLETLNAAYEALSADEEAIYAYSMTMQLTLLITSLGVFFAFLILEFFLPLLLGNGQTLGKKIFGIALMRTDGIKITGIPLFVRTILGKYAVETMVPVLILLMLYFNLIGLAGTIVLILILIVEAAVLIATRTNSLIHDLLASTVAVDFASQMIFPSREALIAYKEKLHAEKAASQPY